MARLPYPFKGAARFVVDSEGVATDQRADFIRAVNALFEQDLTSSTFWPVEPTERPVMLDFGQYRKAMADPEAYADEPVRKIELNQLSTFPSVAEAWLNETSTFDQEMIDTLISNQLKAQRGARERLIFEEHSYNGNPDCLLGIEECTCGLPRGQDGR